MKLLYTTSIDFPSFLTNRLQIIQMAQEFQNKLGEDFVLGGKDIVLNDEYKINIKNFNGLSKSYVLAFKYLLLIRKNNFTHIYCREEKLLFFMIFYNNLFFKLPLKFIYESHQIWPKKTLWYKIILKKSYKIIVLTKYIKENMVKIGIDAGKIEISPDGVDLNKFNIDISKKIAREKLNLPQNKKLVIYTGTFFDWKGTQILAESSEFLSEEVLIIFIGGKKHHGEKFKEINKNFKNILIVGPKPHNEIPLWLKSADVLVLPNTAKEDISNLYTSPMKLFEYMASNVPIVASDIPSIREILNDNNSVLIEPDNKEKLADAISMVLNDTGLAGRISKQAFLDVQNYTWEKRVDKILNFIK